MKKAICFIFLLLNSIVYTQVDSTEILTKQAEFPGGIEELYKFLNQKVKYPNIARNNNYQGKVYVRFMVDTIGNILDPVVLNKGECHQSLEEEAIRVVKLFPNFIPAKNNSKKVNSFFTVPVNFVIYSVPLEPFSRISIKDNTLEYVDDIRDYESKPKLNQEVSLNKFLKEELKGLKTSIVVGFDVHKTGATKSVYIIDSYRELTKEEKSKIIAAFKKVQWTPAVNYGRSVNVRCTYSVKID